jgi:hypothetical protein
MTMPNFIIIGAAKAGTTALYHYLRQHPQIFMSRVKEPHFFTYEGQHPNAQGPGDSVNNAIIELGEYQALFDAVQGEMAIGEASPTYLYSAKACERLQFHLPEAKLIAILRQPADRAFSAFMHQTRDGLEDYTDFADALEAEERRIQSNWGPIWHYKRGGLYAQQLDRYYSVFARSQIRVFLYEEFRKDPLGILRSVYDFLGVDPDFRPDTTVRPNVSGIPKSRVTQRTIKALFERDNPVKRLSRALLPFDWRWRFTTAVRNWNLARLEMPAELRRQLTDFYRPDIARLETLLHRDLSLWLQ